MIDNSLYLRKCVRYQGVHWCHRKYGRTSRDKIGLSCIASVKTNTYQKLPNIWLWTSSIQRRLPVFESEHDENWKYLPAIRRYWFDDIDLIIFQIVFFYFILGQNFLVHSSLASRKKTFTHPKQSWLKFLKFYTPFEDCRKSFVYITGYSQFQLRHIWAGGLIHTSYQNKWYHLL